MKRFYFLALIFLCGCGSLATLESTRESNNNNNNNDLPYFNKDLATGKQQALQIQSSSGLTKQDIEKMIPKKRPLSRAGKQNS